MPSVQERLLNVKEAAGYLSVHPETLRQWARQGDLRCYKVNGRWKFRLTELDDFISKSYMPTRKEIRDKFFAQ